MVEQDELKVAGGVGAWFYAMIPAALGGAALMWLAFFTGCVDWRAARRLEGRMADRVGVHGEILAPVSLVIQKVDCARVDRSYLDGDTLTIYITNGCKAELNYYSWHYKAIAPDGTIIQSDYSNDMSGLMAGDRVEKQFTLQDDSRIATVVVWARSTAP